MVERGVVFALLRYKIEDKSASIRCIAWSDILSAYQDCFQEDNVIVVTGKLDTNDVDPVLIVKKAEILKSDIAALNRFLFVVLSSDQIEKNFLEQLSALFRQSSNSCNSNQNDSIYAVVVRVEFEKEKVFADFDIPFTVKRTPILEEKLKQMNCSFRWICQALI